MSLIETLGWTLIQSLWQALLVLAVLRLLLALLPHAPAAARYNLSLGALGLTFAGFIITFYGRLHSPDGAAAFYQGDGLSAASSGGFSSAALLPSASFFTPAGWFSWLAILYLAGLLFFLGKMMYDAAFLWYVRSSRRPFSLPGWESMLLKWQEALGVVRKVRLFMSERVDVPVAAGFLKPVIYLPFTLAGSLEPEQVEAVLLHELAHIRRADFLVNIFQILAETALFFNPFVWIMSRMIRRERENACDEVVVSCLEPGIYAAALLALEENRLYRGQLALGAAGKKAQLFQRIKRIMEMKTRKLNVLQRLLVLLVLSCSLISLAWLVPSAGDAGRPSAGPSHKVATVTPATAKDTTVPGQKPAVAVPVNPPPPPPAIPSPPPPPPQDSAATFSLHGSVPPAMSDSLAYVIANATKSYFASKEWKEYRQKLVEYATKMAEAARQYGPQMQAFGDSMQRYFHSPEWEKYREDLQRNAQSLNAYFKSPEWNDQVKAIRQQAEKIGEQFS
jgi:Zn-dependent protease with chaperone function